MKSAKKTSWGGARPGAGRPKTSPFVSHLERPSLGKQCPLQITLKIRSGFESLRNPRFLDVFVKASLRARRFGLRIIQFSILPNKIFIFCEVKSQEELEKSFKSLNTAIAIYLKKEFKEKTKKAHQGPVFLGRFEMAVLRLPEEAYTALKNTLLAPAKHLSRSSLYADDYSSAPLFGSWKDLLSEEELSTFEDFDFSKIEIEKIKHITATPQFWLSQSGWRKGKIKVTSSATRSKRAIDELPELPLTEADPH